MTRKQVIKNLPPNMIEEHRKMYLKNWDHIQKSEAQKINCDSFKWGNFILINTYLTKIN